MRHALRNAAGPALTVLGVQIPLLIGGAVVAEKMFALPGVAQLALQAGTERDTPVIQGALLVTIAVVLVSNIVVNAVLLRITPQARRGTRSARRRPALQTVGGAA
jgi:peptide/nickel transport system permease protein